MRHTCGTLASHDERWGAMSRDNDVPNPQPDAGRRTPPDSWVPPSETPPNDPPPTAPTAGSSSPPTPPPPPGPATTSPPPPAPMVGGLPVGPGPARGPSPAPTSGPWTSGPSPASGPDPTAWSQVPWRTWEILVVGLLGIIGTFLVVAIASVAVLVTTPGGPEAADPEALLASPTFLLVALAGPAVVVTVLLGLWIGARYGRVGLGRLWRPSLTPPVSALRAVGAAAALIVVWSVVMQIGVGSLVQWLSPGLLDDVQAELGSLAAGGTIEVVILIVGAVILAPLWEELFFRGALFPALHRRLGFWPAALLSSAAFGLVHVEGLTLGSLYLVVQTGLLGVALCWLLRRTRTLLAPIAAHAFNNLFAVGVLIAIG